MKSLTALFILSWFSFTAQAIVVGEQLDYTSGGTKLTGYLAFDNSIKGKRPGILIVHEWWGLNEYARKRARMLASLGYTALAIDMYGDGKLANHPDDASKFMHEVIDNMPVAHARFNIALDILKNHPTVKSGDIAAIGYCFGGGIVLEMARRGAELDAVVSFHGSLGTKNPAKKGDIKARVLVLNGEDDPFVKPEQIDAFMNEMNNADVKYHFVSYQGAKHSFTNPDANKLGEQFKLPLAYNPEADEQSWAEMQKLFKNVFGQ
ncbi:MAG: dienelactone hydrolase family protein [Gammaproteobacteria bacterium]|nr:MAG: dienelactone hydrolase family protein [Gammaproteobacteria bacterium]